MSTWDSIRQSLRTLRKLDRWLLPVVVLQSLFGAAIPFIVMAVSAYALDRMAERAPLAEALPFVLIGTGIIVVLTIVQSTLAKEQGVRTDRAYNGFIALTGEKSMDMDYPQLESPQTAAIRDRIQQDQLWGGGIWSVINEFREFVNAAVSLLYALVLLLTHFWGTALFTTWVTPLYFVGIIATVLLLSRYMVKSIDRLNSSLGSVTKGFRLSTHMLFAGGMNYRNGKEVRLYGIDRLLRGKIEKEYSNTYLRFERSTSTLSGKLNSLRGVATAAIAGSAYLFVALLALGGAFSVGSVFLFASVLHRFSETLANLALNASDLGVSAHRLDSKHEYLQLPNAMYRGTLPVEKRMDDRYELELRHVSFQYPGQKAYALRDVSMKLRIGERLAVVGRNGSGKTTLIKLLCRLYDPAEGVITLNGIDIRKYDLDEYRRIFSVVFQDFSLLSLPLSTVVASGVDAEEERVAQCLKLAGFGERLATLSEGLQTPLYKDYAEDGVELSGGEAQKVALARALYKDAPFVILDEPTAALDPIAEYDVYARFHEIVGARTAVFISHRLSSCRFCQDIAVFDEGRLIQRGGHDALLREAGRYRELWNAQAQYYT